jgi:hypothetical protein
MNSAMRNWIRTFLDRITLALLRWPSVDRFVGLLANKESSTLLIFRFAPAKGNDCRYLLELLLMEVFC